MAGIGFFQGKKFLEAIWECCSPENQLGKAWSSWSSYSGDLEFTSRGSLALSQTEFARPLDVGPTGCPERILSLRRC